MIVKRVHVPAILFFLLVGSLPTLSGADLVRYKITDEDLRLRKGIRWYGLYLANKKVGYLKEGFCARGKGTDRVWVARSTTVMKLQSGGKRGETKITEEGVFDGQPPYAFRRGRSLESLGQSAKSIEIWREREGYRAVILEGGEMLIRELPSFDYTLGDHFAGDIWIRNKPKQGDTIHWRYLDVKSLEIDVLAAEIVSIKKGMVDGVKMDVYESRITSQKLGQKGIFQLDSHGKMLSFTVGGILEARLEPEHLARKIGYSQDLFVFGMAKLDKPLGLPPKQIESLVLRVSGEGASRIPNGPRQSIRKQGDSFLLFLGREHGHPTKAKDKEIRKNLKETVRYPIKHEKLVALARQAFRGAHDDWIKILRLVVFVNKFIEDEHNPSSLPIFEIIRQRRGDCTEHVHLFTALARASGIPAREVTGLAYLNDTFTAFGWHTWNEVVLNGQWVPVDPTWGEFDIDATHISLGPESPMLLEILGQLSFNLVSVNGKEPPIKARPSAPPDDR